LPQVEYLESETESVLRETETEGQRDRQRGREAERGLRGTARQRGRETESVRRVLVLAAQCRGLRPDWQPRAVAVAVEIPLLRRALLLVVRARAGQAVVDTPKRKGTLQSQVMGATSERETERQRQRGGDRQKDRDRQRDRQTDRDRQRQRQRDTERQRDLQSQVMGATSVRWGLPVG
jgi:hypothetical protein